MVEICSSKVDIENVQEVGVIYCSVGEEGMVMVVVEMCNGMEDGGES